MKLLLPHSKKKLTIVVYSFSHGGYGDLLFGLKATEAISKQYKSTFHKQDLEIYLVTPQGDKEKIQNLKGDTEFGVTVKSLPEYQELIKNPQFVVDYYFLGPVFESEAQSRFKLNIPDTAKVIFIPEYSNDASQHQPVDFSPIIYSGFGQGELGIFITEELSLIAEKKSSESFNLEDKEKYWQRLSPKISSQILNGNTLEQYYDTTGLAFEYSHNIYEQAYFTSNICEKFLRTYLLYCRDSSKNQDVISIGKNKKFKKEALEYTLPDLKKAGFTKVISLDLDSGESKCLYASKRSPQKVFRHLLCEKFSHPEMIALLAITTSEIAGTTGDQTFGEGLSARIIMVYECLAHKQALYEGFVNAMYDVTQSLEVKQLAQFLVAEDLTGMRAPIKFKELLHNPRVLEKYKNGCQVLARRYDLATTLNMQIPGLIFGNPDKTIEIKNFIDKIRLLAPAEFSNYISLLEIILTKRKNYSDPVILQAAIMGILLLFKGAIHKQTDFKADDEKNCLSIIGELNKLFPNLSLENEYLKGFCFHCLKIFSEKNPILLHNKSFVRDFLENTKDLKLDLSRIRVGIDHKLDELIFQDYKEYYKKIKFSSFARGNLHIQSKIDFFDTIFEYSENFPKTSLSYYACAGWLLLFQKNLETMPDFKDKELLLETIKSHLHFLKIKIKFAKFYISQLGIFCKENPALLKNPTFIETLEKFSYVKLNNLEIKILPELNKHPAYTISLIENFKENYEMKLARYAQPSENTQRKKQAEAIKSVITTASLADKDKGTAYYAMIGVLFLVRKNIRSESFIFHDTGLLPIVEKQLKLSGINPDSDDKVYLNALRIFLENHYELLSNELLKTCIHSTDSKTVHARPGDLTPYRIKLFQDLLKKHPVESDSVLKLRKKGPGLPYSVLKYPEDKGFYLIDSGEDAILGVGGWGKVKNGYYFDEKGRMASHPVAIKIEENKNSTDSAEIRMFAKAQPRTESYFYKQGVREDKLKKYSIFPKLPGIQLDKYLLANPDLPLADRFQIVKAIASALALMHGNKVAHLDLKAKNILYDPVTKKADIIDFGCAREFESKFTADDLGMGEYMPPELFKPGNVINDKIDIYSCAVTMAHVLNIPLLNLIKPKLEPALAELKNQQAKQGITDTFQKHSAEKIFGEAIYGIPSRFESDAGFQNFIERFCATSALNFDSLNEYDESLSVPDLKKLLVDMTDDHPKSRPTAQEIVIKLTQIEKTLKDQSAITRSL
jgi:Protein kinase domain